MSRSSQLYLLNIFNDTGRVIAQGGRRFSPRSLWFNPGCLHVRSVVDQVALEQVFAEFLQNSHTNHHFTIAPHSSTMPPSLSEDRTQVRHTEKVAV
jgi:hypothetical protein